MKTVRMIQFVSVTALLLVTFGWLAASDSLNASRLRGYISAAVDDIAAKLKNYYSLKPEDRIYAQFDKPMYSPGETIWFNIFVRNGLDFSKSDKSDIVNVEFINPKGGIEKSYKVIAQNGVAAANIDLDAELAGGLYKVKVYSEWQKNDANPAIFEKELQVQKLVLPRLKMKLDFLRKAYGAGDEVKFKLNLNTNENQPLAKFNVNTTASLEGVPFETKNATTDENGFVVISFQLPKDLKTNDGLVNVMIDYEGQTESISRSIPIILNNISLEFFPEGGDIVSGLPTKVAFRALNEFGKAADIEGIIVDKRGNKVAEFASFHNGMGAFSFIPQAGETYKAKITTPENINADYALPEALPRGYVLNISKIEKEQITVQIASTENETLQLIAQVRGNVCYAASVDVKAGVSDIVISTDKFPIGTAQFTLFDSKGVERAERLAFVNKHKQLNIEITTDKEKYLPREEVKMSIKVTDERGMPMPTQLSLAVADDQLLAFADDKSSNILSYMLLEADIKQKVEEPNFYFDPKEEKADQALDYLLMTAGWRRFVWKEVMENAMPNLSFMGEKAAFGGRILNEDSEGFAKVKVEIVETKQVTFTDANGKFNFNFVDLSTPLTIQINSPDNSLNQTTQISQYTSNFEIYLIPEQYYKNLAIEDMEIENLQEVGMAVGGNNRGNNVKKDNGVRKNKVANMDIDDRRREAPRRNKNEENAPPAIDVAEPEAEIEDKIVANDEAGELAKEEVWVEDDLIIREDKKKAWQPIENKTYIRARKYPETTYSQAEMNVEMRSDFRSTIYWNPSIETDRNGKATVTFHNSDAITSFCATIEGVGAGSVGRKEFRYFTQLPVQMTVKIPTELAFGDEFSIPLTLKNNTSSQKKGKITITPPEGLEMLNPKINDIAIAPNSAKTFYLEYRATANAKSGSFTAVFESSGLQDAFTQPMTFVPKGYPVELSFSGKDMEKTYELTISDVVQGSMNAQFTAYPSVINDLLSGIEGILREPYGCFEQTSTSSYPNLLVMRYMEETETYDEKAMARASDLLDKGYKRLVTFETSEKGYEWFGGAPGHEALTAYGLLQFNEMQSVYGGVSKDMVKRTGDWLMSRRDGNGGFMRNSRALDTYGRASAEITNAYIVYSLTEAGYSGIEKEIEAAVKSAEEIKDPYIIALVANTLLNIKDEKRANSFLSDLMKKQDNNGSWTGLTQSITSSTGQSLTVETTALVVQAMLKKPAQYGKNIESAVKFIVGSRSSYGAFGSTQATILALKALTDYAKYAKATDEAGTIEIFVDNNKVATMDYEAGRRDPIEIKDLAKNFGEGKHKVKVVFKGAKNPLPYSLGINYFTSLPNSAKECKVKLTAKMENKSAKTGETVRLSATLQNVTADGLPMTMAVIGIPGGLTAQPWQLKEMQEKGIFDFYEIRGNKVFCYYRQMLPNETREINFDLKAEIPGKFEAPASYAYLYYTNEFKYWTTTGSIKVNN